MSTEPSTPVEPVSYDKAVKDAVAALTVLRQNPNFSEGLIEAITTVAANLGSLQALTADRPGSWESDLIDQILTARTGDSESHLFLFRTAPVIVKLDVEHAFHNLGILDPDDLDTRLWKEKILPGMDTEENVESLNGGTLHTPKDYDETERVETEVEAEVAEYRARYEAEAQSYYERFTQNVLQAVAALTESKESYGLPASIEVRVERVRDTFWQPGLGFQTLEERLHIEASEATTRPDLPTSRS